MRPLRLILLNAKTGKSSFLYQFLPTILIRDLEDGALIDACKKRGLKQSHAEQETFMVKTSILALLVRRNYYVRSIIPTMSGAIIGRVMLPGAITSQVSRDLLY